MEYAPVIKSILASFEVSNAHDSIHGKKIDACKNLRVIYLEKEFGSSKIIHVMHLLDVWLQGSPFKAEAFHFEKTDPEAKWSDMLLVIQGKFQEYINDLPIIQLTLHRSGRVTRETNGTVLTHDFKGLGKKIELLVILPQDGNYLQTEKIRSIIESKSTASVSKTIEAINTAVMKKLQLPPGKNLIESKKNSGYRINPIYNLIIV